MLAQIEQSMYNYMESAYYRALEQQAGILGKHSKYLSMTLKQSYLHHLKDINGVQDFGQIWNVVRRHVQKTTRHVLLRGRHPYEFVKDLRKDTGATSKLNDCSSQKQLECKLKPLNVIC